MVCFFNALSDDFSDITPYCLRHTFATFGINSGISTKSIRALWGHANTRILMDTYMHTEQNDKQVSIDLSDNNKIQFKKWSNIKRYKGMDNYKNELQHRLENI